MSEVINWNGHPLLKAYEKGAQEAAEKISTITDAFRAGCFTDLEQACSAVRRLQDEIRSNTIRDLDEQIRINSKERWLRELADYKLWLEGKPCDSEAGDEWVLGMDGGPVLSHLKSTYFSIMTTAFFSPEFEEPTPSGIAVPHGYSILPGGFGLKEIWFGWEDDNGLFAHPAVGGHYVAKQADGIALDITVSNIDYFDGGALKAIHGKGFVTEYTRPIARDISIKQIDVPGKWCIVFPGFLDDNERHEFRDYPRWLPYYNWLHEKEMRELAFIADKLVHSTEQR